MHHRIAAAAALAVAIACSSGDPAGGSTLGGGTGTTDVGGNAGAGGTASIASGYLHTSGTNIVDAEGHVVRLSGLSWFGLETSNYAPHGLWSRPMGALLDEVKALGYNTLRIPYSNQLFDAASVPNGIDYSKNPDLVGLNGLQLLDKLVEGARARGLRVILDRHRPDSGGQSELWYTTAAERPNYSVSEDRWISDWKMLAAHYKGDATVIGVDLHNEPHGAATWGDGNLATDWRLAAERGGNAVLSVNPDLLVFVEGVENAGGASYWWGGNLRNAKSAPVELSVAGRVVYSPHDYPASVFPQTWFSDATYPANLPSLWDTTWGYLVEEHIAPVWIGEFGTRDATTSDQQWFHAIVDYVESHGLSFAYWCLNPNSGDTGGILQDDWTTVNADKQAALSPVLASPL